jgi:hypothetical protein
MKQSDFIQKLDELNYGGCYEFDLARDNTISGYIVRGPHRGAKVNPLTALAHKQTGLIYDANKRGTQKAARALGINQNLANNVYEAVKGSANRGNIQVVRGRIKNALGV